MPFVDPSRENWQRFKDLPRDQPIHMLNLIKFHDLAHYPTDHADHGQGITGREAYRKYAAGFQAVAQRLGMNEQRLVLDDSQFERPSAGGQLRLL